MTGQVITYACWRHLWPNAKKIISFWTIYLWTPLMRLEEGRVFQRGIAPGKSVSQSLQWPLIKYVKARDKFWLICIYELLCRCTSLDLTVMHSTSLNARMAWNGFWRRMLRCIARYMSCLWYISLYDLIYASGHSPWSFPSQHRSGYGTSSEKRGGHVHCRKHRKLRHAL